MKSTNLLTNLKRRSILKIGGAVGLLGATGFYIDKRDRESKILHNLSIIGDGKAVVVQIHDPGCQICRRLKGNTLATLDNYNDILYRVADITTSKGRAFQAEHNVPNITLLLFNEKGRRVGVVRGLQTEKDLDIQFSQHFDRLRSNT